MPYRRLPTTDLARLRAMERLLAHSINQVTLKEILSDNMLVELKSFFPRFQNAVSYFNVSQKTQSKRGREYNELVRKARIYISHFIQVINMGIARGEMKPDVRRFYQLDHDEKATPNLATETSLVEWGKILIDGDQKRIMAGGSPIYNPSIALVRVNYEKFYDAWKNQKVLQANTARNLKQVAALRDEANKLIAALWDELEAHYGDLTEDLKREKCTHHGVVYVFRRSELKNMKTRAALTGTESTVQQQHTKRILPEEIEIMNQQSTETNRNSQKLPLFLQAELPF